MCLCSLRVHVCGESRRDIWHRRSTSRAKNWLDRMQRAFAVVTVKTSLCFGTTSGVESAKNLLCHPGSDECRGSPAVSTCDGAGNGRANAQRTAQHACCADVSACGVRPNGHNRVTEMTSVKSSKVGTMLQRDCDAKSHVIACTITSVHGEASKQAASSGRLCAARNGSPRNQ